MTTLKNWNKQQPEVVYFVQTDYQGDEFMKKLVRSKMSKEQWDKIIAKYSDCEIYKHCQSAVLHSRYEVLLCLF